MGIDIYLYADTDTDMNICVGLSRVRVCVNACVCARACVCKDVLTPPPFFLSQCAKLTYDKVLCLDGMRRSI